MLRHLTPLVFVASVALAGVSWAQQPPDEQTTPLTFDAGEPAPSLIACSYDEAGRYTGADTANPGEQPGPPVQTGSAGDDAWRLVIEAQDGTACPRELPH